jgi:hypothetical protein
VPRVDLTGAFRKDQDAPSLRKKQGRVLKNSLPNIRGKELQGIKVISRTVLRVLEHHQDMKIFITNEVILFLHNIFLLDLLCHHLGIILVIIHLLIIVVCT